MVRSVPSRYGSGTRRSNGRSCHGARRRQKWSTFYLHELVPFYSIWITNVALRFYLPSRSAFWLEGRTDWPARKGKRLPDLELDLFVMANQLKIRTVRGNEPGAVRSRCERDQEVKM
jgi:hypothetical protein